MILIRLAQIIFFSFLLLKSADFLVISLRRIAKTTHAGIFAISAFILALSTSFPELFVAITSGLEDTSHLSLGNVIGANITNLSFVAGLAAVAAGAVTVHGEFLRREVGIAFVAGLLPLAFILDGTLSRVDGLALVVIYIVYVSDLFRNRFYKIGKEIEKGTFFYRFFREISANHFRLEKEVGRMFLGVALLLISADQIVKGGRALSDLFGIPVFVVGLFLISLGTTLPELAFSFKSLKDRQPSMFFGNILGSIITNSTLVAGIAAILSPIEVESIAKVSVSGILFILVFLVFWFFVKSKARLERKEAVLLLILYLIFVLAILL